eukprot:gene22071-49521_t
MGVAPRGSGRRVTRVGRAPATDALPRGACVMEGVRERERRQC